VSQQGKKAPPGQFAAKAEQTLGIIPGTKLWSAFPFAGLNLQDTPPAIDDKEFSYCENFFRLGNGYLRTAYDAGAAFYTAPRNKTLLPYFFWYNIGATDYVAAFFTDGTAVQVRQSDGVTTPISSAIGTFYSGTSLPVCVQWGTQYIVIANNNAFNGFWIWDGSLLYQSGTVGPQITLQSTGANYSSTPTVTPFGGAGSGITVTPTVINGQVQQVVVTNPGGGYVPGDQVQLQFSGGGSDTGAILEAVLSSGTVASASVTNGGSGYSTVSVQFSAPTGDQATATAIINAGSVQGYNITNPGGGYVTAPTVTVTGGGGNQAAGFAVIQNGFVVAIHSTNAGRDYTSPPTVTISPPPSGTTAQGTATLSGDAVDTITITNPGSGYTSPPTVALIGDGINATAVAFLASGSVAGINVINGGSNFTFPPPLTIQGGNGVGAVGNVRLTATSISSIAVTSGGGPYSSVPGVVFHNADTNGSGASGTAIIENGQVIAVTLNNAGSGYTLPPYISFSGGGLPTGAPSATATAYLTGTSIASVIMSNQGTGYTQTPAVIVNPGSNNAAQAIMTMMPFGISGADAETFNSRIWLVVPFQKTTVPTGGDMLVSAAGSLVDYATADGGVAFLNSDRFLRKNFTGLRQSNGYLYAFGDSSASVISNVQTTGDPPTTTFTFANVDPQIGMAWRDSQQDFGRTIVSANATGIYGLYGGAMTNISAKITQLFQSAVFPPVQGAVTPCSAVADVFNVKYYFLLCTITDPETFQARTVLVGWNSQTWGIFSQTPDLTFIGTQEVNGQCFAWGTDGRSIYPLFNRPSTTLVKRITTKMYGTDSVIMLKDFLNLYLQAQDQSDDGININVNMVASGIAVQPPENDGFDAQSVFNATFTAQNFPDVLFAQPQFPAPVPYFPVWGNGTGGFTFSTLAAQMHTTSPDFVLSNIVIAYQDTTAYQ